MTKHETSGTPAPQAEERAKEPPLGWSNFEGPKRNVDWQPDDQDLIYTAINFRDDEWGDADEDAGQQIVERLLSAWNRVATSEQITFEIAARLLKERDAAEAARAEEWRLRRDAEGSRDAAQAACDSLRIERDHFHEKWRACWAPLTPRSENEKQGFERVLAILKSKLSDGGGIVGPSEVQRAHNDFYRGRRVAFEECATMLRAALAATEGSADE